LAETMTNWGQISQAKLTNNMERRQIWTCYIHSNCSI